MIAVLIRFSNWLDRAADRIERLADELEIASAMVKAKAERRSHRWIDESRPEGRRRARS